MLCLACARPARYLCRSCESSLRPSRTRFISGVVADAAFAHEGAAPRLVHNLKYRRSDAAGRLLARSMASHVHPAAGTLVPIPRAAGRVLMYGIDPAVILARRLAEQTGLPMVNALDGPVWWPRRAGRPRRNRTRVGFRLRADPGAHVVLIDDVLTTGETATSAVRAFGRADISILTATSAGTM